MTELAGVGPVVPAVALHHETTGGAEILEAA
jgi:hypothetical protein